MQKLFCTTLDAKGCFQACQMPFFPAGGVKSEIVVRAQYLGFSDAATSGIVLAAGFGGAVGLILGGISGDVMARRWPNIARPLSNQARPGGAKAV